MPGRHGSIGGVPLPAPDLEPTDDEALRALAGSAVRHLGHALVGHHAAPDLLRRVADGVEALAAELDTGSDRSRPGQDMQNDDAIDDVAIGAVMTSHADRPVSGAASPWGVDLVITRTGEHEVTGRCILRSAHEGAPARSHGGVVAAIFDDLFGFVLHIHGQRAFTGELSIRYEAPTPLHVPLEFRARLVGTERRKLFMEAEAYQGEQRLVTSKTTFISFDPLTTAH